VICIKLQKEKTTCLPWNPVNSRGYPITNPVIDSSCTCPPSKSFSHIYEIAEENPQEHSYSSVIMNKDVCLTRLSNQLMFFSTVDWVQWRTLHPQNAQSSVPIWYMIVMDGETLH
jgi:hypothetical protein